MTASRQHRRRPVAPVVIALVAVAGALAAWLTDAADPPSARAAAPHRAVIVIDDGVHRTSTCVRFDSDSISGIEALRRAVDPDPVTASFGSGEAVCGIGGVGCPASGCLTCQAPAYWHYFRSTGGGPFRYSGTGGSATTVRDGDIEAWVWGSTVSGGSVPQIATACGLEPPEPPPTAAPTSAPTATNSRSAQPAPAAPAAGSGGNAVVTPQGAAGGGEEPAGAQGQSDEPPTATEDTEPDTTVAGADAEPGATDGDDASQSDDRDPPVGEEVAGAPVADTDDGQTASSLVAVVLFGVLVAASVTGFVLLRRRSPDPR